MEAGGRESLLESPWERFISKTATCGHLQLQHHQHPQSSFSFCFGSIKWQNSIGSPTHDPIEVKSFVPLALLQKMGTI